MDRNQKGQFTKGSTRTTEEELKRIQGMKNAWQEMKILGQTIRSIKEKRQNIS